MKISEKIIVGTLLIALFVGFGIYYFINNEEMLEISESSRIMNELREKVCEGLERVEYSLENPWSYYGLLGPIQRIQMFKSSLDENISNATYEAAKAGINIDAEVSKMRLYVYTSALQLVFERMQEVVNSEDKEYFDAISDKLNGAYDYCINLLSSGEVITLIDSKSSILAQFRMRYLDISLRQAWTFAEADTSGRMEQSLREYCSKLDSIKLIDSDFSYPEGEVMAAKIRARYEELHLGTEFE